MTENKRFTVHIRWFNYEKTEGEIELFDNGQPLLVSECIEDVQMVKELLNELAEENEQSKMMIATLRNIILENEDLEKENKELKEQLKDYIKKEKEEEIRKKREKNDIRWSKYRKVMRDG